MPLKPLKFASIDIGSNAIRMLFCYVFETSDGPFFRKGILLRVPLRLGDDAFKLGRISTQKEKQMISAMHSFKHLMDSQQVISYRAYATSAMRDAINGPLIVEHISKQCGIDIEIITGEQEADVISSDNTPEFLKTHDPVMYADVGGGSTELTIHNGDIEYRESFNIGTIRYMINKVDQEEWTRMKEWLKSHGLKNSDIPIIGSGGNINKIYKMRRRRDADFHISSATLKNFYEEAKDLSNEERMIKYNLNPDRTDVIIPATEIFLSIINYTGSKKIFVPKMGLSDGIIRGLYEEYKEGQEA